MLSALAFLGRHATAFMAGGVLLGVLVPPLASLAQPLLIPTLLIPLTLALVRLDWSAIGAWRTRGGNLAALVAWLLLASPLGVWALVQALVSIGFPAPLGVALILMAASSPIVSSVAIALIVGLDAALAIVAVLLTTALVPFTLPLLASALTGVTIELGVAAFMLRLVLLVGTAFGVAWIVRRWVPQAQIARRTVFLDGLTVINLVLFGLAIMDGVTAYAIDQPVYVLAALAAAYAFNLLLQAAGYLAFRGLGRRAALTVALVTGNCNMGLVLVALQGRAPFEVTIFFALGQIPMYTLPALLTPLYREALAKPAHTPKSR